MKIRLPLIVAMLMVAVSGWAFDIYLLQDTFEQPKMCDCFPCAAYCFDPPKFRVFGDLESARKALRESSPVGAYRLECYTLGCSEPICTTKRMDIITDKDLRDKPVK